MDHSTGTLESADGLELFYQRWRPEGAPRASLAILHGLGGHSGQSTYAHLIAYLVPLGYSIWGLDLRGHGRSEGRRGSIDRWQDYRSDLRVLLQQIETTESSPVTFLLGQSLGGLIVLEYVLRDPRAVRGVIAVAPSLSVPKISPLLMTLLKVLAPIRPHLVLSPKADASALTRDPAEVQKMLDDPLTDPKLSPRLTVETLSAIEWTQGHAAELQTPLLLLHGTADPLSSPEGSKTFFERVTAEDKVLKLYEDGRHQPTIDTCRQ